MRRPNPWIIGPAVAMGIAGVIIGRAVARASCSAGHDPALGPPPNCTGAEWGVAIAVGLTVFVGVLIVAVLAARSFEEWRRHTDSGSPPPGPGCEAPEETPPAQ